MLKRLLAKSSTPDTQHKFTAKRKLLDSSDLDGEPSKKRKLDFIHSAHEALSQFSDELNICEYHCDKTGEQLLVVTTKAVYYHEPAKYLCHLKLVVTSNYSYYIQVHYIYVNKADRSVKLVQVLFKVMEEGKVENIDNIKGLCKKLIDPNMTVCSGISVEEYESYKDVIRYDLKNVHVTTDPFTRIASQKCLVWFPIPRSTTKQKKMASEVACTECAKLKHDLRRAANRISSAKPETKVQHQQAESSYPLKYLSPASLKTRKANIKSKQMRERRMLKKYIPDEVILDDQQHQEMCQIQSFIEESTGDELESLFVEGEQQVPGVGSTVHKVWEDDKRSAQQKASLSSFQEDQERNSEQDYSVHRRANNYK